MWEAIMEAIFGSLTKEQRLFLMRAIWVGGVSFHMVWVCGWIGFTGIDAPFAKAADLAKNNDKLSLVIAGQKQDRVERLDQQIQTVRGQQCRTAVDSPARENYTDRLNELFRKYTELTGTEPHVPRCDET